MILPRELCWLILSGSDADAEPFSAIENGPWLWQSTDFDTGYSEFYKFCDAVEVGLTWSLSYLYSYVHF